MNSSFFKLFLNKTLIFYLCTTLLAVGFVPTNLYAMFLPSSAPESIQGPSSDPAKDQFIQKVQKTLESKILQQRLKDLGLSPEQILSRISQLSDDEIHRISSKIDALQTGGGDDPFGVLLAILVIAILAVVVLQATGHKVIITR